MAIARIFWKALDELVSNSKIVIDRPRGSASSINTVATAREVEEAGSFPCKKEVAFMRLSLYTHTDPRLLRIRSADRFPVGFIGRIPG